MKKLNQNAIKNLSSTLTLVAIMIIFVVPFAWMLFSAFDAKANSLLKLPTPTLQHFSNIFADSKTLRSFFIGLYMALGTALGVVLIAFLAAYPLARYKLKFKSQILYFLLFLTGLPGMAVTIPLYQMAFRFGLIDSINFTIVLMITGAIPYAVWIMKNFIEAIPVELEEAAWVDGTSRLKAIFTIVMPSMLPGILTIFILNFSGSWGNFFTPYLFINSLEKMPISVTIYQTFGSYGIINYGQLAAFSLIYTTPSIVLYILAQKFIANGMRLGGATKG